MNEYQKAILKRIDIFLKMFSNLVIVLTNESSFKSKTNKEINVWYLADKSGVKYDDAIVKQLFNHYQDYCDIKEI